MARHLRVARQAGRAIVDERRPSRDPQHPAPPAIQAAGLLQPAFGPDGRSLEAAPAGGHARTGLAAAKASQRHAERVVPAQHRSEEHTYELQSPKRISHAVFWLKKKIKEHTTIKTEIILYNHIDDPQTDKNYSTNETTPN